MKQKITIALVLVAVLAACSTQEATSPAPSALPSQPPASAAATASASAAASASGSTPAASASASGSASAGASGSTPASASALASAVATYQEPQYERSLTPQTPRTDTLSASVEQRPDGWTLTTGEYQFNATTQPSTTFVIQRQNQPGALALRFFGVEDGPLALRTWDQATVLADDDGRKAVQATGSTAWADYHMEATAYPLQPGLLRYSLVLTRTGDVPNGTVAPELQFVDGASGNETEPGYKVYADPASFTAPAVYGYAQNALDSTLFYFFDRTATNAFNQYARFTPRTTPGRSGSTIGHSFGASLLRQMPTGEAITLYDSFVYLTPGPVADENQMYLRYLQNMGTVYDLIRKPLDEDFDWRDLAEKTIAELDDTNDQDVWVQVDGKPFLRAYLSDSREGAELITLLDVLVALRRYEQAYNVDVPIADTLQAGIPDFYAEPYGMMVNGGPVQRGLPTRGDSWYEMGHHLKLAELALLGDETAREYVLRSAPTLIDWAHTLNYRFTQFYAFNTWTGTGREPDVTGCYAYTMLLLHELTGEQQYLDEATAALEEIDGSGFNFAYETHITAQTAAAGARMYERTNDRKYLDVVHTSLANVFRLVWLWEADYGTAQEFRTFMGLGPTQRSGVSTPKEQYEAWIYFKETLDRIGDDLDPDVRKLVAEFVRHVPQSSVYSLPPLLPPGAATPNPTTYPTVPRNALDRYIPLEDQSEGYLLSGVIGQEIYGAGMTPTYAALLKQ